LLAITKYDAVSPGLRSRWFQIPQRTFDWIRKIEP
jgi:hypothetical protein